MGIANCVKCNKVFQRGQSPLCSDCLGATKDLTSQVIDFVLGHVGLTVEEVAKGCCLPVKDVEEMLFSGRLGMASSYIMFACQSCHKKMSARLRKGHFCPDCAEKIESTMNPLEREVSTPKEKEGTLKRPTPFKEDSAKQPVEVAGEDKGAPMEAVQNIRPDIPPKQESVSPALDSYGFKRVSDM